MPDTIHRDKIDPIVRRIPGSICGVPTVMIAGIAVSRLEAALGLRR